MNEPLSDSKESTNRSTEGSPTLSGSGNQQQAFNIVDAGRLFWPIIILALIAGVSLAVSLMTVVQMDSRFDQLSSQYAITERESRVLQERLNDMKVELVKRGIPLSDH